MTDKTLNQSIDDLIARWDSGDGKPYKGSLIDRAAYDANPDSPSCMCAQGQVLRYIAGWDIERLTSIEQVEADKAVAELLGISRGHAILLRQINDKVDGAPSIVLTNPEKVLGEQAQLVLAFFKYLDSMDDAAWQKYFAAGDAARDAARAAARAAAWDAARDAAWAANEIQGHKVLADKGKPLFFLSLFGFKTIQALIDWAAQ